MALLHNMTLAGPISHPLRGIGITLSGSDSLSSFVSSLGHGSSNSPKANPATCRWRRQGALTQKGRCAGERFS